MLTRRRVKLVDIRPQAQKERLDETASRRERVPPWPAAAGSRPWPVVLLLVELRLQRVSALLQGFLAFLLLLFADRLARRLVGFLGGGLLRL